jgi:hypothetical protein
MNANGCPKRAGARLDAGNALRPAFTVRAYGGCIPWKQAWIRRRGDRDQKLPRRPDFPEVR